MKKVWCISLLGLLVLCSSCTTFTYTKPDGTKLEYVSFLQNQTQAMDVNKDTSGTLAVKYQGQTDSDPAVQIMKAAFDMGRASVKP